ncbi:MAG: phage protease [Pseudomonadota bacterium]
MESQTLEILGLALNASSGAPEWVQLTPAGPGIEGRDGRNWMLPNPEAVVAAFNNHGGELPIDLEHATQIKGAKGEAAPAVGWIQAMEVRKGALWGKVSWNEEGANAVASRSYRYLSPVFTFARATGEIVKMVSAGLTNRPNLQMAALNREGAETEETAMNKAILDALGLAANATETDVLAAITTMKSDHATALNAAQTPDPALFVPKADHELALNRIRDFEKADEARTDEAINAAVDAAIEAGKVAPASKAYHVAACRQDGGLERFQAMVDAAPEIAKNKQLAKTPETSGDLASLEPDAIAVCHQLGVDPKTHAEARAKQEA